MCTPVPPVLCVKLRVPLQLQSVATRKRSQPDLSLLETSRAVRKELTKLFPACSMISKCQVFLECCFSFAGNSDDQDLEPETALEGLDHAGGGGP